MSDAPAPPPPEYGGIPTADRLARERAARSREPRVKKVTVTVHEQAGEEAAHVSVEADAGIVRDSDEIIGVLLRGVRAVHRHTLQRSPQERAAAAGLVLP